MIALENDEKYMAYEIVEFEKLIESQYITRSIQGRADELVIQAKELNYRIYRCSFTESCLKQVT
jgi:peroxiredoxin family protein